MLILTVLAVSGALPSGAVPEQDQLPALQDPPLTQYRAFRRMHARHAKFNHEAWLEAWTEQNGQSFQYRITSERGSEYILNKVLKALLSREQEVVTKGEAGRAELSTDNYVFQEPDVLNGDAGFRYVLLKPKRKDMLLVNGRMVLNQDGSEILRVEGTLSKNPSFWTSQVTIVREFARFDGVRAPVSIDTVAKLKFAGQAQMDVRYEYESVNGRPVTAADQITALKRAQLPEPAGTARASAR